MDPGTFLQLNSCHREALLTPTPGKTITELGLPGERDAIMVNKPGVFAIALHTIYAKEENSDMSKVLVICDGIIGWSWATDWDITSP
jgi:hypothetical protein